MEKADCVRKTDMNSLPRETQIKRQNNSITKLNKFGRDRYVILRTPRSDYGHLCTLLPVRCNLPSVLAVERKRTVQGILLPDDNTWLSAQQNSLAYKSNK